MKILLFLNGAEGSQTGIEDGFTSLVKSGEINELNWFYYENYAKKNSAGQSIIKIKEISERFQPELIVFFHISSFPISKEIITNLKEINSKPKIIYDEGDMYGGFAKPVTKSMKLMFRNCDIISIRGLGRWAKYVRKYNKHVIYTPHCDSLYRFTKELASVQIRRRNKLIFIGNRVGFKFGNIRRLAGAHKREIFVKEISKYFGADFKLYGDGWRKIISNCGILEFNLQVDICSNSLIHLSFEHYPDIPYYFSDRLPIALSCGQIYVCHYHDGYENIFKNCEFIYFFNTSEEAIDIIKYLLSLNDEELQQKSIAAQIFCERFLSPHIVWRNFFNNIVSV